jgi:hypothetical protein
MSAAPRFSTSLRIAWAIEAKCFTMPPQQGFWLDDDEGLIPCSNHPSSLHEEDSICFRTDWSFHLTLEHDQLLSLEGIFCNEFRLASANVCQGSKRQ